MGWNGAYGTIGGWGGWGWLWPLHFLIPLVFLGLIIAVVVLVVRSTRGWASAQAPRRRSHGLDVLEERYARGEINRDEYLEKKRDIAG